MKRAPPAIADRPVQRMTLEAIVFNVSSFGTAVVVVLGR